jgi:hypothetical protein
VERDDVAFVARLTNPYLLRFYFHVAGMPEDEFLRRIRASTPAVEIPGTHETADEHR